MSITVQPEIKEMCDSILTPSGFHEVTKGTYSKLINGLLSEYLVKHYGNDWFSILEAYNSAGAEETAMQTFLSGETDEQI